MTEPDRFAYPFFDVHLKRLTPLMRLTYRVRERISLESEFAWERSRTVSPVQQEDTIRQFWYLGYRVDL